MREVTGVSVCCDSVDGFEAVAQDQGRRAVPAMAERARNSGPSA